MGVLATLHTDKEAQLGVRGGLLGRACGVRQAQSGGSLEMTGKFPLVDEIEHGLQGMPLVFYRDLADGADCPSPPCAQVCRWCSASELRSDKIGETSPEGPRPQGGEPGAFFLEQIFGDNRDAQGG